LTALWCRRIWRDKTIVCMRRTNQFFRFGLRNEHRYSSSPNLDGVIAIRIALKTSMTARMGFRCLRPIRLHRQVAGAVAEMKKGGRSDRKKSPSEYRAARGQLLAEAYGCSLLIEGEISNLFSPGAITSDISGEIRPRKVLMALAVRDAIGALTETWRRWGHVVCTGRQRENSKTRSLGANL
jgi:hypothetical protein